MRILIYGAGRHGRVVHEILRERCHDVLGWLDDNAALWRTEIAGLPVLGGIEHVREYDTRGVAAIVAMGHNPIRLAVGEAIRRAGIQLVNAVHRSAVISPSAILGRGNCICAGAIIGTNTRIGDNTVVNTAASIDHDCVIGDGVWVAPGVHTAGGVSIERGAYISTGAVLGAGVHVGEGAIVGAGAVVIHPVPARTLALGVPARVAREIDDSFDWGRLTSGRRGAAVARR